jgi:hypothetical protein
MGHALAAKVLPRRWPRKVAMSQMMSMKINATGELPEPLDPMAAIEALNKMDGYEITEADQQMQATGGGQLVGEFLLDREGIIRWSFTEVANACRALAGRCGAQQRGHR